MSRPHVAVFAGVLSSIALAACGGNVVTTPIPSSSETITTSTTSPTTFPTATLGAITVNVVFPPTTVATAMTVRVSLTPFPGMTPQSQSRAAQDASSPAELYLEFFPALPTAIDESIAVSIHELPGPASPYYYYRIDPLDLPLLDPLRQLPAPTVPLDMLLEPTLRVLIDSRYPLYRELNLPPAVHP